MDPLSDTYNFLLMSKIFEILALFSVGCIKKDVSYSIPSRQEIHLATSYADYIEKHYQEDISLTDVAEHFQYTSSYFSRHFSIKGRENKILIPVKLSEGAMYLQE